MSNLRYFNFAFVLTAIGLALGAWLGFNGSGTAEGALQALFIVAVLAVLEVSLSFDNAIVNAKKLGDMQAVWQKRFLTWGIVLAVFGMRIVFPLVIVAVAAGLGPVSAVTLAIEKPAEYASILTGAHVYIAGFGGAFLMMVGLSFFFAAEKDVHWVRIIEANLSRASGIKNIEIVVTLLAVLLMRALLPADEANAFFFSGVCGLLAFLAVEILGDVLDAEESTVKAVKGGFGAFLYLEVLDASFSFDGVIGAFALSQNLFVIAIGLGIGATYVRSMTLMLVDKGTLAAYRYLEHGAFYAIIVLAGIMMAQTVVHIPEVVTGLFGAALIGLALWSSVRWKKANPETEDEADEQSHAIAAE